jgi:hypothetical protein
VKHFGDVCPERGNIILLTMAVQPSDCVSTGIIVSSLICFMNLSQGLTSNWKFRERVAKGVQTIEHQKHPTSLSRQVGSVDPSSGDDQDVNEEFLVAPSFVWQRDAAAPCPTSAAAADSAALCEHGEAAAPDLDSSVDAWLQNELDQARTSHQTKINRIRPGFVDDEFAPVDGKKAL